MQLDVYVVSQGSAEVEQSILFVGDDINVFFPQILFFNYSFFSVLFCFSFRCTAEWLGSLQSSSHPLIFQVLTWHHT